MWGSFCFCFLVVASFIKLDDIPEIYWRHPLVQKYSTYFAQGPVKKSMYGGRVEQWVKHSTFTQENVASCPMWNQNLTLIDYFNPNHDDFLNLTELQPFDNVNVIVSVRSACRKLLHVHRKKQPRDIIENLVICIKIQQLPVWINLFSLWSRRWSPCVGHGCKLRNTTCIMSESSLLFWMVACLFPESLVGLIWSPTVS